MLGKFLPTNPRMGIVDNISEARIATTQTKRRTHAPKRLETPRRLPRRRPRTVLPHRRTRNHRTHSAAGRGDQSLRTMPSDRRVRGPRGKPRRRCVWRHAREAGTALQPDRSSRCLTTTPSSYGVTRRCSSTGRAPDRTSPLRFGCAGSNPASATQNTTNQGAAPMPENNDQITAVAIEHIENGPASTEAIAAAAKSDHPVSAIRDLIDQTIAAAIPVIIDRKSTRLNSSHVAISYAVFCLIKKTYI